ncbi:unnamed protein product, partial [Symbiodinium pilosum]
DSDHEGDDTEPAGPVSGNRRLDEPRSFTMDVDGIAEKTAEAIYPSILAGSHVPINPTRQRLLAAHVKA